MKHFYYSACNIPEHEDELLTLVCIDEKCNKHRLLCPYCMEEHQGCILSPVTTFLKEFNSQLNPKIIEIDENIENLEASYDEIVNTIKKAQLNINQMFEEEINIITNTKSTIRQIPWRGEGLQVQMQKLQDFVTNKNQENFFSLLTEIVDFKPNSDRFSFTIKKTQGYFPVRIQERIANGKLHLQQYQKAINYNIEQLKKQQEAIKNNLTNFFLSPPINLEQNNNNLFQKSNLSNLSHLFSQIEPNSLETNSKQIDNNYANKNNQNVQQNKSPIQNLNSSTNHQQISNSQIPDTYINSIQKQSFSNNKQIYNDENSNKKDKKLRLKSQFKQHVQQNTTNSKQPLFNGNLPLSPKQQLPLLSPKQQPIPLHPTQQQQSLQKSVFEDDNQVELQTTLNLSQEQSFQIESNGKEITKLLFLSKSVVAGICGTEFFVYDFTTRKMIQTLNAKTNIIDAAYMEIDDFNGTLLLATKQGYVEKYIREQNINHTFKFNQQELINKFGNLFIQINQQEKQLITLGEENIIKTWQLNNISLLKKYELQEIGTTLHFDSPYVYVGGNTYLYILDMVNQMKKIIKIQETKIISIKTHQDKLIVGLQDKIKIFERKKNMDYQLMHEQTFGDVRSMQIFKKWPITIVSCTQQQQQQLYIYNYESYYLMKLQEQIATCYSVIEFEKEYFLGCGQQSGQCIIYRIEQTQQEQSK